ncbi:MAG: ribulose-phosphate 3-epimerase [bacterium]
MFVYPAILTDKKEELKRMLKIAEAFCKNVHIDITDGAFVPSKSISYDDLVETNLFMEIHLMVSSPIDYVEGFKKRGAKRIIFHIESNDSPEKTIEKIKDEGLEVGISLNPETPILKIEPLFKKIDLVLIMSVVPGFYGSQFIPDVLLKAKEIKEKKPDLYLEMDGGIKLSNISLIKEAGVNIAAVGSEIFKSENPSSVFEKLLALSHKNP